MKGVMLLILLSLLAQMVCAKSDFAKSIAYQALDDEYFYSWNGSSWNSPSHNDYIYGSDSIVTQMKKYLPTGALYKIYDRISYLDYYKLNYSYSTKKEKDTYYWGSDGFYFDNNNLYFGWYETDGAASPGGSYNSTHIFTITYSEKKIVNTLDSLASYDSECPPERYEVVYTEIDYDSLGRIHIEHKLERTGYTEWAGVYDSRDIERTNWTYIDLTSIGITEACIDSVWRDSTKTVRQLNTDFKPVVEERFKLENRIWVPKEKDTIIYDIGGNVAEKITYRFNSVSGKYDPFEKYTANRNYAITSDPPIGSGTEVDPYQISSLFNLLWISENQASWDKYFIQTADIDATETLNWNDGKGWVPIGHGVDDGHLNDFTGSYNGQGHKINNLYINRPVEEGVGLFGQAYYAEIKNLGLLNCYVNGSWCVGILVGVLEYTTVSQCYSTGVVTGSLCVGGLTGSNENNSTVSSCFSKADVLSGTTVGGLSGWCQTTDLNNCYATGNVNGSSKAGGLVGWNYYSSIENCYSTGQVSSGSVEGGLIGWANDDPDWYSQTPGLLHCAGGDDMKVRIEDYKSYEILFSFWDIETSGLSTSSGGTGLTTAEMKNMSTFTTAGWDFALETVNGTNDYWNMYNLYNNGYPYLNWEHTPPTLPAGEGTASVPYRIENIENLLWITRSNDRWDKHYIQTADIDISSIYKSINWTPIGNTTTKFTGSYDGQGHTIDGLYVNLPSVAGVGLFGRTLNAEISGIVLTGVNVTGGTSTGGLVGYGDATVITNCHADGTVIGANNTGGIAGAIITGSQMTQCGSSCAVTGVNYAGGLAGYSTTNSVIADSYSDGSVTGTDYIGGIAGRNHIASTVMNCYSKASVSGNSYLGGLLGLNSSSSVLNNSYAASTVTGTGYYKGGGVGYNDLTTSAVVQNVLFDSEVSELLSGQGCIGRTTLQMKTLSTYTSRTWDFVGETANGTNDYWNMYGTDNSGYPFLSWQILGLTAPGNITIAYTSAEPQLCWTAASGASSYKIYSTTNPYAEFPAGWTFETIISGTSWTDTSATGVKKFYVIVAVSGKGEVTDKNSRISIKKEIEIKR
jgi:hypothetical protein